MPVPLTATQIEAVKTVVDRFLAAKEATPRNSLLRILKSIEGLNQLVRWFVLKTPDQKSYLPITLAFQFCGDLKARETAKHSVTVVAQVLKHFFDLEQGDRRFTANDIWVQAGTLGNDVDLETIKLGMYLAPEFDLFSTMVPNSQQTEFTSVGISELVVEIEEPATLWDTHVERQTKWIESQLSAQIPVAPGGREDEMAFRTASNVYRPAGREWAGGTGRVLEVMDEDGSRFALKLLKPESDSKRKQRFRNELHFCFKNTHKNVIKVLDFGVFSTSQGDSPFYVMPLYGDTLRTLMKRGIPAANVLPLFSQFLDGVESAHLKGMCHRDLKPENMLYDPGQDTCVVADFGIASFKEEDLFTAVETSNHERLANFVYAAPEQRARGKDVDKRADIFALGLILNEMFTGEVAQGAGYRRVVDVCNEFAYLDEIIEETIQQSVERRTASIKDLKEQLIARGNDFINQQKLNRLKSEVIPEDDTEDPLIQSPVQVVDVDYRSGTLCFKLEPVPNDEWIEQFWNLGTYQSVLGKGPNKFTFQGGEALIPASDGEASIIVGYFRVYVEQTNSSYADKVKADRVATTLRKQRELQQAIADEEKRLGIVGGLRRLIGR